MSIKKFAPFFVLNVVLSSVVPAFACGPFLFDNDELDSLSLLEPSILGDNPFEPFLLFASPSIGHAVGEYGEVERQNVIRTTRVAFSSSNSVSNVVLDFESGSDVVSVSYNYDLWRDYLINARKLKLTDEQVRALVYDSRIPKGLPSEERQYFASLAHDDPSDPTLRSQALAQARNGKLPTELRQRFAFFAIRSMALSGDPAIEKTYAELTKALGSDHFVMARAAGYRAMSLLEKDRLQAMTIYVSIFRDHPQLRAYVFPSLDQFAENEWTSWAAKQKNDLKSWGLFVRFLLQERDFSAQTLRSIQSAEANLSSSQGEIPLFVLYRMVEMVEKEAGVSVLLNLVQDPSQAPKSGADVLPQDRAVVDRLSVKGVYTELVNEAVKIAQSGQVRFPRVWYTLSSYLSFYNGDYGQFEALYAKSLTFPAENDAQRDQSHVLGTMVAAFKSRTSGWDAEVQKRWLVDLDWAKSLDSVGHNRGLYHSLVVLSAQKYLSLDQRDRCAMAFGMIQTGENANLYKLDTQDSFWAYGFSTNSPVNVLLDVLMRDTDVVLWKKALADPNLPPLEKRFVQESLLSKNDLEYFDAYRKVRGNQPEKAIVILQALAKSGFFEGEAKWNSDRSVFSVRSFSYQTDQSEFDPRGEGQVVELSLLELARKMLDVKTSAEKAMTSGATVAPLLDAGEFWFSLQKSGLPLIFDSPSANISFAGNMEYYYYDGTDLSQARDSTAITSANAFPLVQPRFAAEYRSRFDQFQKTDFSALSKARAYFQAVLTKKIDPEAELRALLFLHAMDGDEGVFRQILQPRYRKTQTFERLESSCEAVWDAS